MKKRFIMVLCCFLVLVTTVTVIYSKNLEVLFDEDATYCTDFFIEEDFDFGFDYTPVEPPEMATYFEFEEIVSETFCMENVENTFLDICSILSDNDFELSDEMQIKNAFITTAVNYNMNPTELEYIKTLFEEGYDIQKVLEVFEFLRFTNCDYTVICDIYNEGIENSDNENWVYNAYDKFFNRTDDILSVEDIAFYVNSGLTVEEIVGAYELSFAGVKTTKQMLSEKLSGKSWNEIAASSLSKTPEIVINAPEMTIDEIMIFRNVSVRQRKDFSEIVSIENGQVKLDDTARSKERSKTIEKDRLLFEYNVTPIFNTSDKVAIEYANDTSFTFDIEEQEEDLIPLEESEVE